MKPPSNGPITVERPKTPPKTGVSMSALTQSGLRTRIGRLRRSQKKGRRTRYRNQAPAH
jgi:hypothetical protein